LPDHTDKSTLSGVITLRQLRYLGALARHRHFGRAAEACAVTQPALSMQIRGLEKTLGVDLVERRPNDVVLTPVGLEVAQRAAGVLTAARDLVDFARHCAGPLTGRLQLGIIPSLAPYVLPKLLPVLQARYPELQIELRETQTRFLIEELSRGTLDVVMLALPVAEPEIETLALFDDPFLLAVPAADPRPDTLRVSAADIDRDRLILLEEGHCLRDQAVAFCAGTPRDSQMGLGATSLATVMQMIANGFGVTLMPRIAADVELRDDRVKLLRFAAPEPGRVVGLAWRKTSPRKDDFAALGVAVTDALGVVAPAPRQVAKTRG
jgi:LysR family transcriptional regulator, hydrogen peroxide-inducible genes activator